MICFEVSVNGKGTKRAGIPNFAVLTATLTWVKRRPRPRAKIPKSELNLHVGGLDSNGPEWDQGTQVRWGMPEVKPGDTITIRIVEAERVDPPETSYPSPSKPEVDAMRKKSARHYLALFMRQRKLLDRQIADVKREMKRLNVKRTIRSSTRRQTRAASWNTA